MIKSFFKKVFASSEPAAESSEKAEHIAVSGAGKTGYEAGATGGSVSQSSQELEQAVSLKEPYIMIQINRDQVERHNIKELDEITRQLYADAQENAGSLKRLRLSFGEELVDEEDSFLAKRIGKFLDFCEEEIMDMTFFLDKQDLETMNIYKAYLLPKQVDKLNSFLRERCMMIYETCEGLGLDYRDEVAGYFKALGIPLGETFFEEFDYWRTEVLAKQLEEEEWTREQSEVSQPDPTMMEISKEEVESETLTQIDDYMAKVLETPEQARRYKGNLVFSFSGFAQDGDIVDLMNRRDINNWASLLLEKHPHIFYFLNDDLYPMTRFLTSLVVTTEVEDDAVYYNEEELRDFRNYVSDCLRKLSAWLDEDGDQICADFDKQFS